MSILPLLVAFKDCLSSSAYSLCSANENFDNDDNCAMQRLLFYYMICSCELLWYAKSSPY